VTGCSPERSIGDRTGTVRGFEKNVLADKQPDHRRAAGCPPSSFLRPRSFLPSRTTLCCFSASSLHLLSFSPPSLPVFPAPCPLPPSPFPLPPSLPSPFPFLRIPFVTSHLHIILAPETQPQACTQQETSHSPLLAPGDPPRPRAYITYRAHPYYAQPKISRPDRRPPSLPPLLPPPP